MNMPPSIFQYIKAQETAYQTDEMRIGDNWHWNMRNHIQMIFHLKNNIFWSGENNWLRAFKNIMEPILNLSYWSEQIELKDIVFYIEEEEGRVLSFLVKKYHDEVYSRKHNLDAMFDEITESDIDYGGVLVQKTTQPKPEVIPLNSINFCDQTDILGGPIGFRHYFSPDKLRSMSKIGWGKKSNGATATIEELITLAEPEKIVEGTQGYKNKTSGKNIEVYIVRGNLPRAYLDDSDDMEDWFNQLQIVAFYPNKAGQMNGCVLYRKKEEEGSLKFFTSKEIYGRALGRSVGEALLHPQVWSNFLTIHKMNMLEAASKVPLYTDDPAYTQRQKIQDMENLEITTIEDGKKIYQVPTASPVNVQLFERSIDEWYTHAQTVGSANDPLMGKDAPSGTTFRGQNQTVQQGRGIHIKRLGQRAKFIEEIYRDEIIPEMVKEMNRGKTFLATLSSEEMTWVADQFAENYASKEQTSDVLNGRPPRDFEQLKQQCIQDFQKKGNKHLFEILKGELSDVEIKMGIDIAGKQKDLHQLSDKVASILQTVIANPQNFVMALQIPGMADKFQDVLEFSNISQVDFATLIKKMNEQQLARPSQQNKPQSDQPQPSSPQPQIAGAAAYAGK
jgi:hypothetical protein